MAADAAATPRLRCHGWRCTGVCSLAGKVLAPPRSRLMSRILAPVLLLVAVAIAPAQGAQEKPKDKQAVAAAMRDGQTALADSDFDAGIAAFRKVTELDPANARGWQLLGYCLHAAKRLDEALPAHLKAAEFKEV